MEGGKKYDDNKPRTDLLPAKALLGAATVLGYGAKKYGEDSKDPYNWRKGIAYSRLYAAALRHLLAFNDGENIDQESGICHVYHALVNLMFLAEMYETRTDLDDRYATLRKQSMTKAIDTLCTAAQDSDFIRSEK